MFGSRTRDRLRQKMAKTFYILAEEPATGVYGAETLCKFGATERSVSERRSNHERALYRSYGRHAQLEVYFKAVGSVAQKERHIRHRSEGWAVGPFGKNTEWRICYPPKLAKLSMKVAEEGAGEFGVTYIRDSRHRQEAGGELLLSTYVSKTVYDRLRQRSKETGHSVGELTTEAINRYLDE